MPLAYRENYWDSPDLKKKFIHFMIDIFALDLSLWDSKGFWDKNFKPYSYFDDSSLVANVCVYSMDMMVGGKRCRVAQISSVGTRPEYRREGIGFELMQKTLERTREEHDYYFLFADDEAFGLYKKCGFRYTDEYKARINISGSSPRPGVLKLNMERSDHIEMVFNLASEREPVSNILGVFNEKLFMFWCLYALRDHIYYIPDLEVLVLYKRNNGLLTLFDIVAKKVPSFKEIYPYIRDPLDGNVEFLFMADKLQPGKYEEVMVKENGAHLSKGFSLKGTPFIFPYTSHA
jgi:ribosomal protein S18 acetylase RimI-like enzyme